MKLTKEIIQKLKDEGKSYAQIGKIFALSRQRVHQIHSYDYSTPPENHKKLTSKKRKLLGLPEQSIKTTGGRDFRREIVRMRDNHTCQICKRKWGQGQRAFDVHHIDEDGSKTRQIDSVEEFDNLITLCHKCHIGLHFGKVSL